MNDSLVETIKVLLAIAWVLWMIFALIAIADKPTWKTLRTCLIVGVVILGSLGLVAR